MIKRREPPLGPDPDYSCAFYIDPPSHDFCVWLIIAEMMRRYHNAPAPLKIKFGFIYDQLGLVDFGPLSAAEGRVYPCGVSKVYSDQMLKGVLRPAIEMIGAVEVSAVHMPFDQKELVHWVEYDYHIGHLIDAGRAGFEIPRWRVPQWAHDEVAAFLGGTKPVVITLREMPTQPERNSRLQEWVKFAASIEDEYPVLFLRDTCRAEIGLGHFRIWPRASHNVYVRAALAQRARVNMMVGNGPNVWCIFSDAPYLTFKQLVPELPEWEHGTPAGWKKQDHMDVGDQIPWATPLQRLTWTDDTFENISKAFHEFIGIEGALNDRHCRASIHSGVDAVDGVRIPVREDATWQG